MKTSLKIYTFTPEKVVADAEVSNSTYAAAFIADHLQRVAGEHKKILVLLSGGSAVTIYKKVFDILPQDLDLSRVIFSLVDERYLEPGDKNSNEQQLRNTGVIKEIEKRGSSFIGWLAKNRNGSELAELISKKLQPIFSQSDHTLMLAGMGADGHSAGWLPTQTVDKFEQLYKKKQLVTYYQVDPVDSDNPYRERLTITLGAVAKVDQVILTASGAEKRPALEKLVAQGGDPHQLPALTLYKAKNQTIILTDQKI